MHYYKRNLGDYAKKAGRLSILQHGVYNLLIDACYDREQFPTKDEAIEWVWASSAVEIEAVEFVLRKFFVIENGLYVQPRIREEITEYHAKAETNKRIANTRKSRTVNEPSTNREENITNRERTVNEPLAEHNEPSPNHKPLTINQEPRTNPPCSPRGAEEENPHLFSDSDTRRFFAMPMDWQPDLTELQKYVNGKSHAGKPLTTADVMAHIQDYREATHAKGETRTESEWCRALVKWAQRCLNNPKPSSKAPTEQAPLNLYNPIITPPPFSNMRGARDPELAARAKRDRVELFHGKP